MFIFRVAMDGLITQRKNDQIVDRRSTREIQNSILRGPFHFLERENRALLLQYGGHDAAGYLVS